MCILVQINVITAHRVNVLSLDGYEDTSLEVSRIMSTINE